MTIKLDNGKLASIVKQYGVAELYVFGSVARDEALPDSDVDLLYRLKPGATLGMLSRQQLIDDLQHLFGREVSLLSYDSLIRHAQKSRASRMFLEHITPDLIRIV
ncbi:nucleotidyltransferase family protein [Bifidobacterium cebidarum]|uniref:Nucleotidyltransferase family protein n=1 Tax=Bifidobacterium cebidarum TaxID=2650773 RepID=A0A6I1GAY1_9BIFI|nr:nucleotidyltransferase domain-containing protein [Bifidobacterium cebidarum]KAB7788813.1 nucleotidyltransferase family protein [Bifidobacterium cebidarum]